MYFFYLLISCYTSTLIPSVNSYVVLAANLNDFKSLAKKYVPNKDLVDQINLMVLETGQKQNRGTHKEDEPIYRTVENVEEEQHDSDEVQGPVYRYQLKSQPRASLFELQEPAPIKPLAGPTVLTIDDVVDTLKHRLLQEIIDKSRYHDAQVNKQAKKMQLAYKNVESKPKRQVKNPIPMKVLKEEIQFEGTYKDTRDKGVQPRIQYLGQVQIPPQYLKKKPVTDKRFTKKVVPKKQKFVSLKDFGAGKKVQYVKQVLVPANSNQGWSQYIPSSGLLQQIMNQPILGQQPNIVQPSFFVKPLEILEPQLSLMQQPSLMQHPKLLQQPSVQQPSIVKQLSLMQQQIDRLNKIAQQNIANNKQLVRPTLSTSLKEIDAVEAPFEISLNPSSKEDRQKTNDSKEDIIQVVADTLSEETTIEPVAETTKALSIPNTEENEQFIEEDTAGTVENFEVIEDTTPEVITEASSNNEEEENTVDDATTPAESFLVKADNAAKFGETTKNHTQEFGKSDGQPIVEKTYNFDAQTAETKVPVKLNLPVDSARKVMLF